MSTLSLLRASQLAIGALLSIVCVDLASCWTLLNASKFLVWDAISVSLKVVFILLSIYRTQFWQGTDHTKGLIGHDCDTQRLPFGRNLAIVVIHSLILLISLLRVCLLTIHWKGSVLAAASCMMGLSLWAFDLGQILQIYSGKATCNILGNTGNVQRKILITNMKFVPSYIINFARTVLQSTPAGFLFVSLASIVSAVVGNRWGTLIDRTQAITILSIQGAVILSCIICYFSGMAPTPFPGTGPMSEIHWILHFVLVSGAALFVRTISCGLGMFMGIAVGHLVAASLVYSLSKVRKYDPSKQHVKVVTTSHWWSAIILCFTWMSTVSILFANHGGNMKLFTGPVENLVKFQNAQCVKYLGQSDQKPPFEAALKELVVTVNEAIQAFNQCGQIDKCVKAVPQVDTDEKLDKTTGLVSRGMTDIMSFLFRKANRKSSPMVQLVKVYEKFCQCTNALKVGNDPQQTDQNNECTNHLNEFTKDFDKYLSYVKLSGICQWISVSLTAVAIMCHVLYIGQNAFIIQIQAGFRSECVEFCEKYLGEKYRLVTEIVEWALGSVPAVFLAAFVSYRWTIASYNWTVVPAILSIVLMAVSLYTHDGASKPDASSTDDEPIPLENVSPDSESSQSGISHPQDH